MSCIFKECFSTSGIVTIYNVAILFPFMENAGGALWLWYDQTGWPMSLSSPQTVPTRNVLKPLVAWLHMFLNVTWIAWKGWTCPTLPLNWDILWIGWGRSVLQSIANSVCNDRYMGIQSLFMLNWICLHQHYMSSHWVLLQNHMLFSLWRKRWKKLLCEKQSTGRSFRELSF